MFDVSSYYQFANYYLNILVIIIIPKKYQKTLLFFDRIIGPSEPFGKFFIYISVLVQFIIIKMAYVTVF